MKIYAILLLTAMLLLGACVKEEKKAETAPQPEIKELVTPATEPAAIPTTAPTTEPEVVSTTPEATPETMPVQTQQYTWDSISINFPESLKNITAGKTSYHYVEILEGDGTPVSNDEEFSITVNVQGGRGKLEPIATYENKKWLIALLIANKGSYQLDLTLTCEYKKGYCIRLYKNGSISKSTTFEVV